MRIPIISAILDRIETERLKKMSPIILPEGATISKTESGRTAVNIKGNWDTTDEWRQWMRGRRIVEHSNTRRHENE